MADRVPHAWDAAWLRTLLTEKKVRKPRAKWDLSDRELKVLAVHISIRAEQHRVPIQPSPITTAFLDTETELAAAVSREGLERRREASQQALAWWGSRPAYDPNKSVQLERFAKSIAKISAALSALDEVAPILKPAAWPRARITWRDHAVDLAREFVRRLRKCQPGHAIGITIDGPVAAYVRAVVPYITGEEPQQNNVAGYLKAHKAEILEE